MPITKTQFYSAAERHVRELMREVHAFLSQNRELAYSETELQSALGISPDAEAQAAFREALRALDGLEAISWGLVNGAEYYTYHQDLDLPA